MAGIGSKTSNLKERNVILFLLQQQQIFLLKLIFVYFLITLMIIYLSLLNHNLLS